MGKITSAWFPKRNGKYEGAYHETIRKPKGKIQYDFNLEKDRLLFLENNYRSGKGEPLPPVLDIEEKKDGIKYIFKIVPKDSKYKMSLNDWCDLYYTWDDEPYRKNTDFLKGLAQPHILLSVKETEKREDLENGEIIDELIQNNQFDLLKSLLSKKNFELNYSVVADKLLDYDLENDSEQAIELFLWLDLRQCDVEDSIDLDLSYYLEKYVEGGNCDMIDLFLNLRKIDLNFDFIQNVNKDELKKIVKDKNIGYKECYKDFFELEEEKLKKNIDISVKVFKKCDWCKDNMFLVENNVLHCLASCCFYGKQNLKKFGYEKKNEEIKKNKNEENMCLGRCDKCKEHMYKESYPNSEKKYLTCKNENCMNCDRILHTV